MDMIKTLRRFPMSIASLALLLGPLGCGSDSPSTPVAEVPALPYVKDDVATSQPSPVAPAPMPSTAGFETPGNLDQAARTVDRDVQRTAGAIKDEARDAKGEVKKAIEDAKHEADHRTEALGNDARKAAEAALDNLLGNPK